MKPKTIEKKKPANIMLKPSIKKAAEKKAAKTGLTLSQLIEILLFDYSAE